MPDPRIATVALGALAALLLTACGGAPPPSGDGSGDDDGLVVEAACEPTGPPADAGLDPFYAHYCEVAGIPIVAAAEVDDAALEVTARIVATMLEPLPSDAIRALHDIDLRVGVIGAAQVTTDMPEYADLDEAFPGTDWDEDTRGLGATEARPLTSSGEENLLCLPGDPYAGESILVHEFAHTVQEYAVAGIDAEFAGRLDAAYGAARDAGLWTGTYAATNAREYWAEGVQSYFGVNGSASPPDGVHNDVDTRAELMAYDPQLYALVDEVFGGSGVEGACAAG